MMKYDATQVLTDSSFLYSIMVRASWGHDLISKLNGNREKRYNTHEIKISLTFYNQRGGFLHMDYDDYPIPFDEPYTIENFFSFCLLHFNELNERYIAGKFMMEAEKE